MITNLEQTIRDYLSEVLHMSLASCANNKPWVCEVHFVFDNNLNLYFRSLQERRHSKEIMQNPYVAGNIVKQHSLDEHGVQGVYFEGTAKLLSDVTTDREIFKLFEKRLGATKKIVDEAQHVEGHQFYQINVSKYYLFDSKISSPSHKYELKWKEGV